MENKKTKLTISGKLKKPINYFDNIKSQAKKTVVSALSKLEEKIIAGGLTIIIS